MKRDALHELAYKVREYKTSVLAFVRYSHLLDLYMTMKWYSWDKEWQREGERVGGERERDRERERESGWVCVKDFTFCDMQKLFMIWEIFSHTPVCYHWEAKNVTLAITVTAKVP